MFILKTLIFLLLAVCFCVSCMSFDISKASSNNSVNLISNEVQTAPTIEQNVNNSNDKVISKTNQKPYDNGEPKSPYQTKPRRKKIEFPKDCVFGLVGEYPLRRACAYAINDVLPDLPQNGCIYKQHMNEPIQYDDGFIYNSFDEFVDWNINYHPGATTFYPLASNKYLIEIYCDAGAYNEQNIYLLYDESAIPAKAKVLDFPYLEFTHDEDSDIAKTVEKVKTKVIGGRYFDPKTKKLIVFVKARGIGDAGRYARYSFPNGKPKLEEFRAKFKWEGQSYQAGDVIKSPPKTWKRYYPK